MFSLIYLNRDNNLKRFNAKINYLTKDIIKNYTVLINEKNFYDQPVDSEIKSYEKITKLTTVQSKDYTIWSLVDYEFIKNHYTLIAVGLRR